MLVFPIGREGSLVAPPQQWLRAVSSGDRTGDGASKPLWLSSSCSWTWSSSVSTVGFRRTSSKMLAGLTQECAGRVLLLGSIASCPPCASIDKLAFELAANNDNSGSRRLSSCRSHTGRSTMPTVWWIFPQHERHWAVCSYSLQKANRLSNQSCQVFLADWLVYWQKRDVIAVLWPVRGRLTCQRVILFSKVVW